MQAMTLYHTLGLGKVFCWATHSSLRPLTTSVAVDHIHHTFARIFQLKCHYGFDDARFKTVTRKNVMVEYGSPNIAKKFHAGHFRSTVVGQAIANIMGAAGHNVTRINYLGDWGMQFAILSLGFETYGDEKCLKQSPLKHLFEVYVKANVDFSKDSTMKVQAQQLFSRMEQNDQDSLNFWELCRSLSLEEYKKLYQSINVIFDCYESESMYCQKSQQTLMGMRQNGYLTKLTNGSEGIDISTTSWYKSAKLKPVVTPTLLRSNQTTLYLTRDIAAAISRHEKYNFDQMIYVTDKSQIDHFLQLFSILELLGYEWAKREASVLRHISFGRIIGMKTRRGKVVFLEDILEEALERTRNERLLHYTRKSDIVDEDAMLHTLALSGLVCNDLKPNIGKDYRFSWSSALQSKGDTGLFLQYTHSRLQSLIRSCGVELNLVADCSSLANEQLAMDLFSHLSKFSDAAWLAYSDLEPSHVVKYMLKLSRLTAKAHKKLNVKDQKLDVAQSRLLLFSCAKIVLNSCMKTVGIQPLDKM